MNFELTILMPCLNEEETIGSCIKKAQKAILNNNLNAEILIADNGSSDNSVIIAQDLGVRVIHVTERGYGNVLQSGILHAKGKYVIMADSDDSYDVSDILPFIIKLREGYHLIMGNRFLGGIENRAMPFLHKYIGNPVLTKIGQLFFGISIGDFHCGFRGFDRQAIIEINLTTTGMEFASEMIVKSSLSGYKISQVPVKLHRDGRSRPPHLRTWSDGWRHLRFLLLYSPKWLFFYPGVLTIVIGFAITLILLPKPLIIGSVKLDVHTMLYSAIMILIGVQILTFYYMSKIFAVKMGLDNNKKWLSDFYKYFSLEKGLAFGGAILLLGMALTIYSIILWDNKSFGNLNPSFMLRIIIPSVTSLMLGIQIIFNSFFISILGLKTN